MAKKPTSGRAVAAVSTIGEVLQQVFPQGTTYQPRPLRRVEKRHFAPAPFFPFDLFAAAGLLLQRAAAYQKITPEAISKQAPAGSIIIKPKDSALLRKIGNQWSLEARIPPEVQTKWDALLTFWDHPVFLNHNSRHKPEKWWRIAFELMAIADEASEDVGYWPTNKAKNRWTVELATILLNGTFSTKAKDRHIKLSRNSPSLTSQAVNRDVVCVQPKARTPDVGCCMRNLSHNLALLPPRGVMRVHWMTPPSAQGKEEAETLNVLLVPYPYFVETAWFIADKSVPHPWHWFELRQKWLDVGQDKVIEFVKALMAEAMKHSQVHSIVFPEYALDWATYEKLAYVLRDEFPTVQFLVSGASSNCNAEKGNFALASHFFESPDEDHTSKARIMASVSRPKHHRWQLNTDQVKGYQLEGEFNPKGETLWWEQIPLPPREIHVNAMRSASVFSAMICEDLARTEPAHEPLRAIGPNLIFVLLMDGPQIEWRWSARYSMGLAEDPGCSVLTLTCRALVERWNTTHAADATWSVGLWKDEKDRPYEILCPKGVDAVLITLQGTRQVECTLDGRTNEQTYSWRRLGNPKDLRLDRTMHAELVEALHLD